MFQYLVWQESVTYITIGIDGSSNDSAISYAYTVMHFVSFFYCFSPKYQN